MKKNLCIMLCLILALTGCFPAFAEAGQLILPAGTKIIGDEAFLGSAATDVVIPDGATSIGSRAFADCEDLNSVTVPDTVQSIADDAFGGRTDFEFIAEEGSYAADWWKEYAGEDDTTPISDFRYKIENGEVTITRYKRYFGNDIRVVIPSTIEGYPVTTIGADAFYIESEDIYFDSIVIPEGVKTIECDAFYGCNASSITLPDTLLSIGNGAFGGCNYLTEIALPEGLVSIGNYAFISCDNLEKVVIPASVTHLGSNILTYCQNIKSFQVAEGNPNYVVSDSILYTKDMKTLLGFPYGRQNGSYTVKDGVTTIADNAFEGCDRLTSITLPDTVTSIGAEAFWSCSSLRAITIPESVSFIDESAFYDCFAMTIYGVSGSYAEDYAEDMEIPFSAEDVPEIGATPADEFDYTIEDGEVIITYYNGGSVTVIIPDTIDGYPVTTIESLWCKNYLSYLSIPATVTYFDTDECDFDNLSSLEVDPANPVYTTEDNILYTKDMKTLLAYPGNTPAYSLTIPEGVTTICDRAFYNCNLRMIYLPDSLTEIGYSAFAECYSLKEITIPGGVTMGSEAFNYCSSLTRAVIEEGVTEIPEYAFGSCYMMSELVLPDSLVSIGEYAFETCDSLTEVRLPKSLTEIGEGAFEGCYSLYALVADKDNSSFASVNGALYTKDMSTLLFYPMGKEDSSYIIPEGVTAIADGAFKWNDYLAEISLPSTLVSIGEYAFASCHLLTEIDIPDSVTEIGAHAFDNSNLHEITLPSGLTEIGEGVFESCDELSDIYIPGTVKTIGENAFAYCSNLLTVRIGEGVTTIASDAFDNCFTLGYVYIPYTVASIANDAFQYCDALTIYGVSGSLAENYAATHSIPFVADLLPANPTTPVSLFEYTVEDGEATITGFTVDGCDVTIPDSIDGNPVTAIAAEAFCDPVKSVFIPASVKLIEENAFSYGAEHLIVDPANPAYVAIEDVLYTKDMKTLLRYNDISMRTSFTVPEGVTRIADGAFYSSYDLESVNLPDSLTSIGYNAFNYCHNIESLNLPANLTEIGDYAFYECEYLTSIVIPKGVTELGEGVFACCYNLEQITLPAGLTGIGVGCFEYCDLRTLVLHEGLVSIGEGAFNSNDDLTSVYLPASLTEIGEAAFYDCESLQSITVAEGNTEYASVDGVLFTKDMKTLLLYPYNKSDVSYTVPDGVQTITPEAFASSSLKEITLPEGMTELGAYAFSDCYSLETVHLPKSLIVIGENAFSFCYDLVEITLPDGITELGAYTFYDCNNLEIVHLPESLTVIGESAFDECWSLVEITLPESVTELGAYAFHDCYNLNAVYMPKSLTVVGEEAFQACPSSLTIYGVPGSYAETIAEEYGFNFVDISAA